MCCPYKNMTVNCEVIADFHEDRYNSDQSTVWFLEKPFMTLKNESIFSLITFEVDIVALKKALKIIMIQKFGKKFQNFDFHEKKIKYLVIVIS